MRIRVEGPYYGSYSLAVVNRQLALALAELPGVEVTISATAAEGWRRDSSAEALLERSRVLYVDARSTYEPDLVIRHTWPIESTLLKGSKNFRIFPWEETRVPWAIVDQFNKYYHAVLAPSLFVEKSLYASGVTTRIFVVENGSNVPRASLNPLVHSECTRFLHISSGLPRKGVDLLVAAYCEAFKGRTDVLLTIKTTPNPQNNSKHLIEEQRRRMGDLCPEIVLDERDIGDSEVVELIDSHHFLVLPSRGEGYGLPALEAHLRGKPVIMPRSSALAERFVDGVDLEIGFRPAYSKSHVRDLGSLWFEPSPVDLTAALTAADAEIRSRPQAYISRTAALRNVSLPTWGDIASDVVRSAAMDVHSSEGIKKRRRLIVVSSYQQKCGIATYVQGLMANLNFDDYGEIIVLAPLVNVSSDDALGFGERIHVHRCWNYWGRISDEVLSLLEPKADDDWIVQHHTGFYSPQELSLLLRSCVSAGANVVVTLHSPLDDKFSDEHGTYKDLVEEFDGKCWLLVHSLREYAHLAGHTRKSLVLFPHPFPSLSSFHTLKPEPGSMIVSSFGFIRRHKGYRELIAAWPAVLESMSSLKLIILSSIHDAPDSKEEYEYCLDLVKKLGIEHSVTIVPDHLDYNEIQGVLAYSDCVVFPYHENPEGASGAVRLALSSGTAVLVSKASLFEEFSDRVLVCDNSPDDLSRSIVSILRDRDLREKLRQSSIDLTACNGFDAGMAWIRGLLRSSSLIQSSPWTSR